MLPCYEATKILLSHLCQKDFNIVISVTQVSSKSEEKFYFCLKYCLERSQIVLVDWPDQFNEKEVLQFSGIFRPIADIPVSKEDYIDAFMTIGLEEILLSNMAQHPQYPGVLLSDKKFNPYLSIENSDLKSIFSESLSKSEASFLRHKALAPKIGCAIENDFLFLLTHVKCSLFADEAIDWPCREMSNSQEMPMLLEG